MPYKDLQKRKDCSRRWAIENRDRHRENVQRWRINNSVRNREINRLSDQRHSERTRLRNKKHYWADPVYSRLKALARKHGCLPNLLQQILERDGHMCQYCWKRENLSFDHIIPVSKGGQTEFWNLQILCRSCNSGKKDKVLECDGSTQPCQG